MGCGEELLMGIEEYLKENPINCPDCGEFLWDAALRGGFGDYRQDCPACGWPAPDVEVGE
jgi:predicted RNA-binding Zn-ribbon protein involved in translation (DUF1610 family)